MDLFRDKKLKYWKTKEIIKEDIECHSAQVTNRLYEETDIRTNYEALYKDFDLFLRKLRN